MTIRLLVKIFIGNALCSLSLSTLLVTSALPQLLGFVLLLLLCAVHFDFYRRLSAFAEAQEGGTGG